MEQPFAITLDVGTSLANQTGSWRNERPVYVDLMPPCNHACPAGENIQGWLYLAEEGYYEGAWRRLVEENPFPAVEGRVCYHPCENACNRGQLDEAVNIHAVERFLGDEALKHGWQVEAAEPTGKHVLVVGAGPSGLSAAWHLRRMGHDVTVHDAGPMAGGRMRFGIPKYRLPRDILDGEIARITGMGVKIELNSKVSDIPGMMKEGGFDAAFVAVGAHLAKRTDIPAREAGKILDAISVLRGIETDEEPPLLGRRVVVYRRTREQMPAHDIELEEALDEGVMLHWLTTIKQIDGTTFTVEKMNVDKDGWPQPTGEFETLEADTLVLALGQAVDTSFLEDIPGVTITKDGVIDVDSAMMTGFPGLFAGGDMVPAERTVTVAVGHGKKAARNIDRWLRGEEPATRNGVRVAGFERLNSWYYTDADKTVQPELDVIRRQTTFDEIHGGLDETNALFEARRCLSCGNCFECDNCYGVCPDNAVKKLGPGKRFEFNYDFCKGCGLCAAECPCGAIDMVPERM